MQYWLPKIHLHFSSLIQSKNISSLTLLIMNTTCAKHSFLTPRNKDPKESFYTNISIKSMNFFFLSSYCRQAGWKHFPFWFLYFENYTSKCGMEILYIADVCLGVTFFLDNKLPKTTIVVTDISHSQVQRQVVIVRLDPLLCCVLWTYKKHLYPQKYKPELKYCFLQVMKNFKEIQNHHIFWVCSVTSS